MAIDWDRLVLQPVHRIFGAGPEDPPEIYWSGGAPFQVPDAVFERQHITIDRGNQARAPVSGIFPTLGLRAAALPLGVTIRQNDRVRVREETFAVMDVQPDGMGHILLVLSNP